MKYQAYYFEPVSRPLSGIELEAVNGLSSHIRVTAEKNSAPMEPLKQITPPNLAKYLGQLPPERKDRYLEGLLTEDPISLRAELVQELAGFTPKDPKKSKIADNRPTTTFAEIAREIGKMRARRLFRMLGSALGKIDADSLGRSLFSVVVNRWGDLAGASVGLLECYGESLLG